MMTALRNPPLTPSPISNSIHAVIQNDNNNNSMYGPTKAHTDKICSNQTSLCPFTHIGRCCR